MPIITHKDINPFTELGVWSIKESEEWFLENLNLYPSEKKEFEKIKVKNKRIEWLAVRMLLHHMSGRNIRGACLKDTFGKPYLENSPYDISLSHSSGMAAVLASKNSCGVDIQIFQDKITRLAAKFMNDQEKTWITSDQYAQDLHLIWGAKEALYKTYSRRKVDFKKDLIVDTIDRESQQLSARILKQPNHRRTLQYHWLDNYILIYTYE